MYTSSFITFTALLTTAFSATIPHTSRQAKPCFVVGNTALPAEVSTIANSLASSITCSANAKTIASVPDLTSGSTSFSSINFANSNLSPLAFALDTFSTPTPLATADLNVFQDQANVYTATEIGLRSVGGSLSIKVPKFFLNFQVARIRTARGDNLAAGETVEHLLGKVLKNAAGESPALLARVEELANSLE